MGSLTELPESGKRIVCECPCHGVTEPSTSSGSGFFGVGNVGLWVVKAVGSSKALWVNFTGCRGLDVTFLLVQGSRCDLG